MYSSASGHACICVHAEVLVRPGWFPPHSFYPCPVHALFKWLSLFLSCVILYFPLLPRNDLSTTPPPPSLSSNPPPSLQVASSMAKEAQRANTAPGLDASDLNGSQISFGATVEANDLRLDPAVHLVAQALADSDVRLEMADYFSAACLQLLEPVLYLLGYGQYPIETGPGHSLVAVLVHHADYTAESLNRIIDMNGFLSSCHPLLKQCRSNHYGTATLLSVAQKIRKAVQNHLRPGIADKYPLLASLPMSERSRAAAEEYAHRCQILYLDHDMDMGCVDSSKLMAATYTTDFKRELLTQLCKPERKR
eukprot:TRINITY_DN12416_c2_g1_i4.p2 TRINITY_DN12416_c2_g1~~TRINITY_DN12416_c2_g1_i4.p2  ORF type:complete len:308 (+),score=41.81 TRINITY_DN12416_c2_g1_i4:1223-2146(+)